MKICPLVAEMFHAEGWNSHNEVYSRFSTFYESAQLTRGQIISHRQALLTNVFAL
jgi:hypothetical protein